MQYTSTKRFEAWLQCIEWIEGRFLEVVVEVLIDENRCKHKI